MNATLELVMTVGGWAASAVMLVWVTSRRSKIWDDAEKHDKTLYGDNSNDKPGLVSIVKSLEKQSNDDHDLLESLVHALQAYGHTPEEMGRNVRRSLRDTLCEECKQPTVRERVMTPFHPVRALPVVEDDPFPASDSDPPPPRKRRS